MSNCSEVLSKLAFLDIFNEVKVSELDLKGWIANQGYFIDQIVDNHNFSLRVSSEETLKTALANDCNRMSMAAIETISGIQEEPHFKHSISWAAVRSYYSAFFTSHAFMRLYGISCSQLDQSHVGKILEVAKVTGMDNGLNRLEDGFYYIKISKDFKTVEFSKIKDSHKDTWSSFLKLIDELIIDVETVTALKAHIIDARDLLVMVRQGICRSGAANSGNWLSKIRNQINYTQSHGVWYPFEGRRKTKALIPLIKKSWKNETNHLDISVLKNELEIYFSLSALIISMHKDLVLTCHNRAASKNKIFNNGALKMLRTIN